MTAHNCRRDSARALVSEQPSLFERKYGAVLRTARRISECRQQCASTSSTPASPCPLRARVAGSHANGQTKLQFAKGGTPKLTRLCNHLVIAGLSTVSRLQWQHSVFRRRSIRRPSRCRCRSLQRAIAGLLSAVEQLRQRQHEQGEHRAVWLDGRDRGAETCRIAMEALGFDRRHRSPHHRRRSRRYRRMETEHKER